MGALGARSAASMRAAFTSILCLAISSTLTAFPLATGKSPTLMPWPGTVVIAEVNLLRRLGTVFVEASFVLEFAAEFAALIGVTEYAFARVLDISLNTLAAHGGEVLGWMLLS